MLIIKDLIPALSLRFYIKNEQLYSPSALAFHKVLIGTCIRIGVQAVIKFLKDLASLI